MANDLITIQVAIRIQVMDKYMEVLRVSVVMVVDMVINTEDGKLLITDNNNKISAILFNNTH